MRTIEIPTKESENRSMAEGILLKIAFVAQMGLPLTIWMKTTKTFVASFKEMLNLVIAKTLEFIDYIIGVDFEFRNVHYL